MSRVFPTYAATATSTCPPMRSSGASVSGSTTATYSGWTPSAASSRPRTRSATRRASRSPASIRSRASATARPRARACRRSSPLRYAFRLLIASPSASRTSGQPTIRVGRFRSAAIRRTTASCWASFSPKYAASGPTMFSSLATTVQTPSKCPGRWAPHSPSVRPATWTVVRGASGYISSAGGWKTTSTPSRRQTARSASIGRGYRARSSPGPNCVGLTKRLTTTHPPSARAARIRLACPACRAPIVGTRRMASPAARASPTHRRTSGMVSATSIPACPRAKKAPGPRR